MTTQIQRKEDLQAKLEQIKLLFPTLQKVKDSEILKAIAVARHLGLDPIKKEVHFVPFSGSVQMIVSYTEYIKRAERSNKLNGWKVEFGKDELGMYAEIIIYRKDWANPFSWRVYLEEVRQDTPTWKKMPIFMLRKVAIAQGFRLAFPEETAELPYEEAEIMGVLKEKEEAQTNGNNNGNGNGKYEKATQAQIGKIHALIKELGWTDQQYREFLKNVADVESSKDLTKAQASKIIERMIELKEEEPEIVEAEEDVPF